jgi:hypothetical protein
MGLAYSGMVRLLIAAVLGIGLCLGAEARAQQDPAPSSQPAQPADQFFSGTVTALEEGKITVTRTVLGTESTTRTFVVGKETRVEGKPKLKARVTVRFVTVEDSDRAVHILVRTSNKK